MTKKKFQNQIFSLVLVFAMLMASILILPVESKAAATSTASDSTATLLTNAKTVKYVTEGKTFTLKANESVAYSSTNKAVVTVSSTGKITGKKIGEATIKVTQKSNKNNVQYLKLYITSKLAKTYRYQSYEEMWTKNAKGDYSIHIYPGTRIYINGFQLVGPKGSNAACTIWATKIGKYYSVADLPMEGEPNDKQTSIRLHNGTLSINNPLFFNYIGCVVAKGENYNVSSVTIKKNALEGMMISDPCYKLGLCPIKVQVKGANFYVGNQLFASANTKSYFNNSSSLVQLGYSLYDNNYFVACNKKAKVKDGFLIFGNPLIEYN